MRTKKIYYLQTSENTYMRRHDLYNAGARWDAKGKHWWSTNPTAIKKAAQMLGGDSAAVAAHVQQLPKLSKTFRGGRPRRPRNGNGKNLHVEQQATAAASAASELAGPVSAVSDGTPMAAAGHPFVRGVRGEDRRQQPDRRNESTRPEAVMVIPMVKAPELGEG